MPPLGEGLPPENVVVVHPISRVDDKAAAVENELLERTAQFRKERFVYIFVIITLLDSLFISFAPQNVSIFLCLASLILLIGLANWLEFPWIITHLERWHAALLSKFEGKKSESDKIEPM